MVVLGMEIEKWSFKFRDLFTVANLVTSLRFVLVVPFVLFFVKENYIAAGICIGLSALTDCFDGMLARALNQVTAIGKVLDPIADKVTLIAVAICMLIYMPALLPLMLVLVCKDFLMLCCGLVLLIKRIAPPAAEWYGKVATVVFYLSVGVIIFLKAVFGYENVLLENVLFIITAIAMLFALVNYSIMFFKLIKKNREEKAEI